MGVMDGHGSNEVAQFARDRLPKLITESEEYQQKDYKAALTNAFRTIDNMLKDPKQRLALLDYQHELSASNEIVDPKASKDEQAKDISLHCGCTCNVVLITPGTIYCANAGDCRATLLKRTEDN